MITDDDRFTACRDINGYEPNGRFTACRDVNARITPPGSLKVE